MEAGMLREAVEVKKEVKSRRKKLQRAQKKANLAATPDLQVKSGVKEKMLMEEEEEEGEEVNHGAIEKRKVGLKPLPLNPHQHSAS